jgi:hypothetical protein
MTRRRALTVATIAVVFVTSVGRARGQSQDPTAAPRDMPMRSVKTMADLRASTEDEKVRALYFHRYGAFPLKRGDERFILPGPPVPPPPPGVGLPTYEQFLQRLACLGEQIVLGRAEERGVHLNQRGTFLFTDYDVAVERWLRPDDPRGAPSLKLSVSGGRVTVGGRSTTAEGGKPLDRTRRYIFFLQQIPGSTYLTPSRPSLADGDPWIRAIPDLALIPETAAETIRFDSLANDIARLGGSCAPAPR